MIFAPQGKILWRMCAPSRKIHKVVNLKQVTRVATHFRRRVDVGASSLIALPNGAAQGRGDMPGAGLNFGTRSTGYDRGCLCHRRRSREGRGGLSLFEDLLLWIQFLQGEFGEYFKKFGVSEIGFAVREQGFEFFKTVPSVPIGRKRISVWVADIGRDFASGASSQRREKRNAQSRRRPSRLVRVYASGRRNTFAGSETLS